MSSEFSLDMIVEFVARETSYSVTRINLDTRILHDIGVDGEDAEELIERFAQTFQVDMTAFRFEDYFHQEPHLGCLGWLFSMFGVIPEETEKEPITIYQLACSVRQQQWVKTEIQ